MPTDENEEVPDCNALHSVTSLIGFVATDLRFIYITSTLYTLVECVWSELVLFGLLKNCSLVCSYIKSAIFCYTAPVTPPLSERKSVLNTLW